MKIQVCLLLTAIAVVCSCDSKKDIGVSKEGVKTMSIEVTSSAFADGELIPAKYTADGENVSPPLRWKGVPENAESIVIINDDPDAPVGTWVHWVVYDLGADVAELAEATPADEILANGAKQGTTDFGRIGYGGPAPPSGTHRYFFKVYALDAKLDLPAGATKEQVVDAMEGHVLAKGELVGRYKRR